MRVLALILARAGSKRLPGKNGLMLGSKPLIRWSLDVAREVPAIGEILVSTDDEEVAALCRDAGALVPWLRPAELATDTSSSLDAVFHALDWYERERGAVDGVLLLQPTSPFRTVESVNAGIDLFVKSGGKSVIGVSPSPAHPMWTFRIEQERLVPFVGEGGLRMRSQDLAPAFVVNGSFYLATPASLHRNKSFFGEESLPLLIESPEEALDIDTPWDFQIAQQIAVKK